MVHIISISREKIGIGRLIHPLENGGLIMEKLQERLETMHYHITTQFWVLTGTHRILNNVEVIAVHTIEIKQKETSEN